MVSKEHNRGNKMYSNAITQVLEKEHKNKPTLIQKEHMMLFVMVLAS